MEDIKKTTMNEEREIEENTTDMVDAKVSKELKKELSAVSDKKTLGFLCDQYYQSQDYRITAEGQARSLMQGYDETTDQEHPEFIKLQLKNARLQEALNKKYIDIVTDNIDVCRWMKAIKGIGPIFSGYFYSVFDLKDGMYGSDFVSYAGLNDNNVPWLGSKKADELMKEAIEYQENIFDEIFKYINTSIGDDVETKKRIKKLKDVAKISENYVPRFPEIEEALGINLDFDLFMMFYDSYIQSLVQPSMATDLLYGKVSELTKRKKSLLIKGATNQHEKKKAKAKVVTVDELKSFVAMPPYNTELKSKLWMLADVFVRNKGRGSLYGRLYDLRKEYELERNENGVYADQARNLLETKNYQDKTTIETLESGKLTLGHINLRCKRVVEKVFVSHLFEAMYWEKYHKEAPAPYVIAYKGHHDYIPPEVDYKKYIK